MTDFDKGLFQRIVWSRWPRQGARLRRRPLQRREQTQEESRFLAALGM